MTDKYFVDTNILMYAHDRVVNPFSRGTAS